MKLKNITAQEARVLLFDDNTDILYLDTRTAGRNISKAKLWYLNNQKLEMIHKCFNDGDGYFLVEDTGE